MSVIKNPFVFVQVGERHDDEEDEGDSDDGLGFQLKSKPKTIDEILANSDDEEMEVEQVRTSLVHVKRQIFLNMFLSFNIWNNPLCEWMNESLFLLSMNILL